MKYKYIYASGKLLIEDDCIAFLEEMSNQGWKLKRVFFSLFIFEKWNAPLKYQLDYSDYDQEYVEVIENLGYEYICLFKDIKFYCHHDLTAVDLQTDSIIYELSLLKRNNISSILSCFLCILISWILIYIETGLREKMPADFYIYFNKEVMNWGLYVLIIYFIFQIIKKIDIRYKIKHRNLRKESLICFHPIFKIFQFLFIITIVCFTMFLLYFLISPFIFLIALIMSMLISNITYMISQNQKYTLKKDSKKKQIIIKILPYTLSIIGACLLIYTFLIKDKPLFISSIDLKPYYEYTDLDIRKETNLYLTQLQLNEEYSSDAVLNDYTYHSETYYKIKDEKVAQIVFEQIVIDNEFLTNETRIEEGAKPIEERKEITHKTYEQAKQHFNQYETSFADICYYYKNQLIAMKDRQIIVCTLDNPKDINNILKHYFY